LNAGQMILYNNQGKYYPALIVPNHEALLRWAKNSNVSVSDIKGQEAIPAEIESVINQYKPGARMTICSLHGGYRLPSRGPESDNVQPR